MSNLLNSKLHWILTPGSCIFSRCGLWYFKCFISLLCLSRILWILPLSRILSHNLEDNISQAQTSRHDCAFSANLTDFHLIKERYYWRRSFKRFHGNDKLRCLYSPLCNKKASKLWGNTAAYFIWAWKLFPLWEIL